MTWNHVKIVGNTVFKAQTSNGLADCIKRYKKLPLAKRRKVWLVTPAVMYSKAPKKRTTIKRKRTKAPPKIIIPDSLWFATFAFSMPLKPGQKKPTIITGKALSIVGEHVRIRIDIRIKKGQTWAWSYITRPLTKVLEQLQPQEPEDIHKSQVVKFPW